MDSVTEGGREEPAPQVAPDAVESTAPERAASNGRGRMLALISLATILVLAIWFSTNAVAPALEVEKGFSKTSLAWLTISVNLGFLAGTLVSSVLNLADIVNARRLFAISAVLGAALNLAVIPLDSLAAVLAVRFVTGAFLAGVYPSTMKIVSGWFQQRRGMALGVMIAALTIGSGSPHLLGSVFADNWEASIVGGSILAALGGLIMPALVKDGPYDVPGARLNPRYLLVLFTQRDLRYTLLGYLGHMWELYAMWAWIGVYLAAVYGSRPLLGDSLELAGLIAFGVFVAGAVGSVVAGLASDRYGRTITTMVPMIISGSSALAIGFLPFSWSPLIGVIAIVWGASVIADSAQFSTAITELSDDAYRGTTLTF